jgi:hypothetical protein
MIQLNLLPHVKLEYIRAQRTRRLVLSVALIVTVASIAVLVLFFAANLYQKKHLNDVSNSVNTDINQLKSTPNIDKILTVQNQLESLSGLHSQKPAASRLFSFLNQLTPSSVSISDLSIDFNQHTVTITGSANALSSINQYVDTLKLTTYTSDSQSSATPAFSQVILSNFGISTENNGNGQPANYTINFGFDQNLFNVTYNNVNLNVPSTTTTRLEEQQPTDLFQTSSSNSGGH